jgi:hypothetical protein
MADYAKMYRGLFRAVTSAIELLQKAQLEAEEIYISGDEPVISIVQQENDRKSEDKDNNV